MKSKKIKQISGYLTHFQIEGKTRIQVSVPSLKQADAKGC